MSILDDIPEIVNDALGEDVFYDAVLQRDTPGPNSPARNPWDPNPAGDPVSYPCKAIHDEWSANTIGQGLVESSDQKILILSYSLSVEPKAGDRITLKGKTLTIVPANTAGQKAVTTDPAKALWVCRARA